MIVRPVGFLVPRTYHIVKLYVSMCLLTQVSTGGYPGSLSVQLLGRLGPPFGALYTPPPPFSKLLLAMQPAASPSLSCISLLQQSPT